MHPVHEFRCAAGIGQAHDGCAGHATANDGCVATTRFGDGLASAMGTGDQTSLGGGHGDGDVGAIEKEGPSYSDWDGDVANDIFAAGT